VAQVVAGQRKALAVLEILPAFLHRKEITEAVQVAHTNTAVEAVEQVLLVPIVQAQAAMVETERHPLYQAHQLLMRVVVVVGLTVEQPEELAEPAVVVTA
jgi:hypothetical protein